MRNLSLCSATSFRKGIKKAPRAHSNRINGPPSHENNWAASAWDSAPVSTIHCPVSSVQLQLSFAIAVSSFSSDTNGRGAAKRWRLCAMSISSYGMTLYVRRARSLSLRLSSSYSLRFRFFLASDSDSELATGRQNRNPCAKCNQCKAESQRKPATMNGQRSWQTNVPGQGARDLRQTNNWYGPDGLCDLEPRTRCTGRNKCKEVMSL